MQTNRRRFLKTGVAGFAVAAGFDFLSESGHFRSALKGAQESPARPPTKWEIGCFNRPWMAGSYDDALAGMQAAGFHLTGILGDHAGEPFTAPDASPEYLDRLKERMESHGLTPIVGWLRTRHDISIEESTASARRQIENAHRLGVKYMLTVGVDPPDQFAHFYQVMAATAEFAEERRIQIVLKPHGGCSLGATEMLTCLDRVAHRNFRIWYDAGNIVHYSDRDPVVEAERLAAHVTGFCAKDCAGRKGDVMLPFGQGVVRFQEVLAKLKIGGFSGPLMVECCGGKTPAEITASARVNREFLTQLLAKI